MKRLNGNRMRIALVGIVAGMILTGGNAEADFTFSEPLNLGPTVNGPDHDQMPSISADGLELYFMSTRPGGSGDWDIWVSIRETTNDPWSEPENLGPTVNDSGEDWAPCVSADGLELYFEANRSGGYGSTDILVASRKTTDEPWGDPVNLGSTVNGPSRDGGPNISPDGLELYFKSNRPGGYGGEDLWVSNRPTKDDPWGIPINIGSTINGPDWDREPSISSDGLVLFFSSARPSYGHIDLWLTSRETKDRAWGEPVNLGSSINTLTAEDGPSISADGQTLYFSDYGGTIRPGGYGGADIWQTSVVPIVDLNCDGIVDSADMCIMLDHWGTDYSLCDIGPMPWGDGIVDVEDLIVLAEHLFEEVPPPKPVVVDDFESYTDTRGNIIWDTWMDYFKNNTGARLGYGEPPYAEVQIVHGGNQAMPFFYDNDGTVLEGAVFEKKGTEFYAETQRQWEIPQDWTSRGVEVLTLWFYGEPDNSADPFYVALEDSAGNRKEVQHPNPAAVTLERWEQWSIPIADFTGVDPTTIKIMGIGVGDPASNQPGGSGLVRIDDIELHRSAGS